MHKIGVLSDSHGAAALLAQAAQKLIGADAIAYLGDGLAEAQRILGQLDKPLWTVRGNCDFSPFTAPHERVEVLGGARVFLCHGDRYRVKSGLLSLALRAREVEAQIALFGHTHAPLAEYYEGVLLVNPGALRDGRYALIELRENGPAPALLNLRDA